MTAALSVAILIAAVGMQLGKVFMKPAPIGSTALDPATPRAYLAIEDADGNGKPDWQDDLMRTGLIATSSATTSPTETTATSTDPLSGIGQALAQALVGGYLSLTEYDAYTPDRGEQLANTIADNFRAPVIFVPHTIDELTLDPNTSSSRAIQYRADMRTALAPLVSDEEYELTLYAAYVQTNDTTWLDRLAQAAERYRTAEKNILAMRIPQDAAPEHVRIANALGAYAETLDRMVSFAKDPLASMALLTTYNEKERDVDLAFDALVKYYARTIGDK